MHKVRDQLIMQIRAACGVRPKSIAEVATNIRFDPDVLEVLKAKGRCWQTRVNELLRADIESGRLAKAV